MYVKTLDALNDRIGDILLLPAPKGESATTSGGLPEELENDPYNILSEIFAAIPDIRDNGIIGLLRIPGFRNLVLKLTDFDVDNIPVSIGKMWPKFMKMSIDEMPSLPILMGNSKMGDVKNWMKNLLTMFEAMEASNFMMPLPFMPPVPPLPPLPLMPPPPLMPWGWSGKKGAKGVKKGTSKAETSDAVAKKAGRE